MGSAAAAATVPSAGYPAWKAVMGRQCSTLYFTCNRVQGRRSGVEAGDRDAIAVYLMMVLLPWM